MLCLPGSADASEGTPREIEIEVSISPSRGTAGNIGRIRVTHANGGTAPLQG